MIDEIQLGQFAPDAPAHNNPGLITANNAFPTAGGYGPIRAPSGSGISVSGDVRGAARFDLGGDTPLTVVGTSDDLHVIRNGVVTASGLGLSLSTDEYWSFDQFGFSVYASSYSHGLFRLGSIFADDTFSASTGSPPRAKTVDAVGDFLFLGNLVDIDTSTQPYRVRWSAFNNPQADWVTDIGRQSGYVDMPARYGPVTAIVGGRFDLIFQKNAVSSVWQTGGPTVFDKKVIEDERGCPAQKSIVRVGSDIYFLAHDGFCRTDGAGVEVISSDRVFKWFKGELEQGYLEQTQGAVDWGSRCVIWSFFPKGFSEYRRQIIYNWSLDRWSTASVPVDWLVESATTALSIDDDDPSVADDHLLDADGPSFDDPIYAAGGRVLMAIVNGEISQFEGNTLEAVLETGDYQPAPGKRSFVTAVTPVIEAQDRDVLISIAGRDHLGAVRSYSIEEAQGPLNFCPAASDARHHAIRMRIPAGAEWQHASALQVDWQESGEA